MGELGCASRCGVILIDPTNDTRTPPHNQVQEEAAAAGKPKVKKTGGKNAAKANELKELEAQLKAMELAKKQKEEKRKAAAAATKVGRVGVCSLGWLLWWLLVD